MMNFYREIAITRVALLGERSSTIEVQTVTRIRNGAYASTTSASSWTSVDGLFIQQGWDFSDAAKSISDTIPTKYGVVRTGTARIMLNDRDLTAKGITIDVETTRVRVSNKLYHIKAKDIAGGSATIYLLVPDVAP